MRRRTFRGAVAVMALTTAALIGTAGSALACYPSDDRATPVPKTNVTTCEDAKLPGETLVRSDELPTDVIDIEGGVPNKDKTLTIKQVAKGVTITAVVVKGGDGYNVYKADKLGAMPWKDLKSPKNGGKQVPTISHWFVCGTTKNTPPETTAPTKPSKPTETTKPSAPATSATSVSPTSTTAPAAVPAGNESGTGGGLANTGFDNMWLVWIGGLLLVAGGGLLALLKFRRKASE
ncbi:LPXTG cell wall anchor domain-containing protein [Amycolatopsis sp. NPDC051128]|uniref:LPXTG cell wall anchor domain-containing protein n=1 Tax=Amycolatopsis sp. NPDC051128 TaxID=3155412 RepID=UPI00342F9491